MIQDMSALSQRCRAIAAAAMCLGLVLAPPAAAQKQGGVLRISLSANPSSLSIHEEVSITTVLPASPVFSNLVKFDPSVRSNTPEGIIPELAESWAWDATGTKLSFKLRPGVTWHDGKPFTAKDVQCTWHRLNGKEDGYFRRNPRRIWYANLKEVTVESDTAATFHLERPQPALLSMLASGMAPVYPCHVEARLMRTAPVGTGPFKFAEFRSNEVIRLARNPDYWRKGQPYLDGIETRIVANRATRALALQTGDIDLTSPGDITIPIVKDLAVQAPKVQCETGGTNVSTNVLINSKRPPFDNPALRRAIAFGLDRQAFIDTLTHGSASISGAMLPPPDGLWGMPPEQLAALASYSGRLEERQAEARRIMEGLGHTQSSRLKLKVLTRDFPSYKDPAVILIDQLSKIGFDAELEIVDSTIYFSRAVKQDFSLALNLSGVAIDDPDSMLVENYACKSDNNFSKYCNPEVESLLTAQSSERDPAKRRAIVWQIEKVLNDEFARPMIYHGRGPLCWQPTVKGFVRQSNSIYNMWRLDGVWLER